MVKMQWFLSMDCCLNITLLVPQTCVLSVVTRDAAGLTTFLSADNLVKRQHRPIHNMFWFYRLKEKLDRREVDHQEEVDLLQATIRELKNKVTSCEAIISDKQREVRLEK